MNLRAVLMAFAWIACVAAPTEGRSRTQMLYSRVTFLNDTFVNAIAGLDRDAAMKDALRIAFAERNALFQIASTTDHESRWPVAG